MNNDVLSSVVAIISAYLLGSIPVAYIVARLRKGIDIRQVGTRNMGAMNVIYSVGISYGLLVLLMDICKGALAVFLARSLGTPLEIQLTAGAVAVIGHIFPVFLKFRGGKGGATCVGVLIYLIPWSLPVGAAIFTVAMLITHFPTFSYSLGLLCAPFVAWLIYHSDALTVFSVIMLSILMLRYLPRIKEMRSTGGSWRRVFLRKGLKDRF